MKYPPFDMEAQKKARERLELETKLESENEVADMKWLCSSKRGRRIVWRLLEQSGVFRLSFDTIAMKMAFNEGQRNFGNRVLALLQDAAPEILTTMTKEAHERRNADSLPTERE